MSLENPVNIVCVIIVLPFSVGLQWRSDKGNKGLVASYLTAGNITGERPEGVELGE